MMRPPLGRPTIAASATPNEALSGALKPALMLGLLAIGGYFLASRGGAAQGALVSLVENGGPAAPFVFVAVASLGVALGLPRQIAAFAGAYAFGLIPGIVLASIAQAIACALDFGYARKVGRDAVARRLGTRLRRIDTMLAARPFLAALTLRLMPVGSNLLLSLAAGLSSVRAAPFILGSTLGYLPQTVVFAMVGHGTTPDHHLVLGIGIAMFVISAALGILLLRTQAAVPPAR
jgi:uncharacterized membrane protein YdjX (TVP38/TMEM64 family)